MQHITWNLLRASFDHRIVDTSFLIQIVEPNVKLASLEECCSHYGIELEGRHHARWQKLVRGVLYLIVEK